MKGHIIIDTDRCKGCALCIEACPKHVIGFAERKVNAAGYPYAALIGDGCIGCASCGIVCPDGCITCFSEAHSKGEGAKEMPQAKETSAKTSSAEHKNASETPSLSAENGESSGEIVLMKGNEAIAHAAIRCGADAYFGYPITPQSEVIETLALLKPWETTGMVVLQAESEVASINMVYGAAGAGKRVLTSSSSPGVALMQEGIAYMAGAEIPGVVVNVQRGGPGLGTIQPSQGDYFQATRGGGNGDYNVIALAPASVQEMADFVDLAFTLAFKYRTPAMILSDGVIGQMMEPVRLPAYKPRRTEEEIRRECPWATIGRTADRKPNIMTSLELAPDIMYERNLHLQEKFKQVKENEVRYETVLTDDADVLIVAFGSAARISENAVEQLRAQGVKAGLFRPITLWPFPEKPLQEMAKKVKRILVVEMNAGQMIEDVRLAVHDSIPVSFFGKMGGIVPEPEEIVNEALKF